MKCVPRSRNLVATVVVFLLAASAPAALALPAGPGGGGGGITWDVTAFFDWMQDVFGGFFGGGGGEDDGLGVITGKLRGDAVPDGHDLNIASTLDTAEDLSTLQEGAVGK